MFVVAWVRPPFQIFEPDPLRALLLECGVSDPEAAGRTGMASAPGARRTGGQLFGSAPVTASTVDALSPLNRERVRIATIDRARRADILQIRTDVVYAIARR